MYGKYIFMFRPLISQNMLWIALNDGDLVDRKRSTITCVNAFDISLENRH